MSVSPDNTGQSTGGLSASSKNLTGFAVGAGANRFIFLVVSQYSATDQVPAAAFNTSENFTVHDAATVSEFGGTRRLTLLRLVAPSNVSATIGVTWPGTVDEFVIGATSWTGVDQTTPLGTAVKNTVSNTAFTSSVVVPNASGDVVHDGVSADAQAAASGTANQTQRWRAIAASNTTEGGGQSAVGAGSDITCQWSTLNGSGNCFIAHVGVAIKAAGAGATINDYNFRGGARGLGMGVGRGVARWQYLSLEAYQRDRAREHRVFLEKVRRAA